MRAGPRAAPPPTRCPASPRLRSVLSPAPLQRPHRPAEQQAGAPGDVVPCRPYTQMTS